MTRKKAKTQKKTRQLEPLAKPLGEIVTRSKLAKIFGFSPRKVGRMEDAGMPVVKGLGRAGNKIDTALAIQWCTEQYLAKNMPTGQGATLEKERLRLITEQADEKAIKNAIDRGELIGAEYVNEFVMTAVANLAGTLSGLAGRMATDVAREDNPAKCREILKVEIDRARNQYADTLEQLAQSFEVRA